MSELCFTILLTALIGLAVGSFLNVCIYRIPVAESIVTPPSKCPSCDKRLKPTDLVPVLSYLFLRGRCRYCNTAISPRYALIEILTAALFILVTLKIGVGFTLLKYLFATSILIVVTFIDLDHFIIPDKIVIAGLTGGALLLPLTREFSVLNALYGIAAASGFLLFLNIVSRGGMGMGDVKFAAFIGIILGWPLSLVAILLACFVSGLTGIILIISGLKTRKDPIPFGPFLSAGTFICYLWGRELIDLYLGFIISL